MSADLRTWSRVRDSLARDDPPAFDDVATWTGSVTRHPDGTWFLFYTGLSRSPLGFVQTIGFATSPDLLEWKKNPDNPVLRADGSRYETLADRRWHDEAFRDPWVLRDEHGDGWHMLITARAANGPGDDRGVVGYAWSADLRTWELRPPLSAPGGGFGQLEVTQSEIVDGRPVLLFSCLAADMAARRRVPGVTGGVWAARGDSCSARGTSRARSRSPTAPCTAVGSIRDRLGGWQFLAFRHDDADGSFVGEIADPLPVRWDGETLELG